MLEWEGDTLYTPAGWAFASYVMRFDSNGNRLWSRLLSALPTDQFRRLRLSESRRGLLHVSDVLIKDSLQLDGTVVYRQGGQAYYLAALDTSGRVRWSEAMSAGTLIELVSDVHPDGHMYLTGAYRGGLVCGDTTLPDLGPAYMSYLTGFIARVDSNGFLNWIKAAPGTLPEDIEALPHRRFAVSGRLIDTFHVGNGTMLYPWSNNLGSYVGSYRDCTPHLHADGPLAYCLTDTLTTILSTPDTPGFQYAWHRDGMQLPSSQAAVYAPSGPGRYWVVVTDTSGCVARSSPAAIVAYSPPPAPLLSGPDPFCTGDTLWGPPGYQGYQWSTGDTTPWCIPAVSGAYTLVVANAACHSPLSNIYKADLVPLPPTPAVVVQGDSLTASLPGDAYRWYRNDTLVASTAAWYPDRPGAYQVAIRQGGCWSQVSAPYVHAVATLSPGQPRRTWQVYPNPGAGLYTLRVSVPLSYSVDVRVYDLAGRVIWQDRLSPGREVLSIDLQQMPAGMYRMRIAAGADSVSEWLMRR
ncbi:MAG: hypothetical protein OHK0039_18370 [Bacteroidia bacterium]